MGKQVQSTSLTTATLLTISMGNSYWCQWYPRSCSKVWHTPRGWLSHVGRYPSGHTAWHGKMSLEDEM